MVVSKRDYRGIILKLIMPGIDGISIERNTIAMELPDTRHGDRSPATIPQPKCTEIPWAILSMTYPEEVPWAIQREIARAMLLRSSLLT